MDDLLADIVADALAQAEELIQLDGPRAEAWASDLVSLVVEVVPDGLAGVIATLREAGGPAASAALWAIGSVADGVDLSAPEIEPPPWAELLGTSQCDGAWSLRAWRGESVAFRFVDGDDARHVLVVDLVPDDVGDTDSPEAIGEVSVGPADLLEAIDDADAGITARPIEAQEAAARVGRAWQATVDASDSFVANSRILILRLGPLGQEGLRPPIAIAQHVPELPPRDADDDAYALDMLRRALGSSIGPDEAAVASAAGVLRAAAAAHDALAQWLAASAGPVDLDDPDLDVVLATLAATVAPASLAPLLADERRAVQELEWADWLGVAIGLVRSGVGAAVGPDELVDLINRCPEITSTIPKGDRARVAWALAVCTDVWSPLGLAADGVLCELGVALLPAMLERAWGPH